MVKFIFIFSLLFCNLLLISCFCLIKHNNGNILVCDISYLNHRCFFPFFVGSQQAGDLFLSSGRSFLLFPAYLKKLKPLLFLMCLIILFTSLMSKLLASFILEMSVDTQKLISGQLKLESQLS